MKAALISLLRLYLDVKGQSTLKHLAALRVKLAGIQHGHLCANLGDGLPATSYTLPSPAHHLLACLSVYLPLCLPTCLDVCLPAYLPACLPAYLSACLTVCLASCLPRCLPVCLPVYMSVCIPISLPVWLSVCLLFFCILYLPWVNLPPGKCLAEYPALWCISFRKCTLVSP